MGIYKNLQTLNCGNLNKISFRTVANNPVNRGEVAPEIYITTSANTRNKNRKAKF